jgi:hypothetical protein
MVVDIVEQDLANSPNGPSASQITFYVEGDGTRPGGMFSYLPAGTYIPIMGLTVIHPADTTYKTYVYVQQYDGFADFPQDPTNVQAVDNAAAGYLLMHDMGVNTQITGTTTYVSGNTTTILELTTNLPINYPLRAMGVPAPVVDAMDSALRPVIEAGYNRDYSYNGVPATVITPPAALTGLFTDPPPDPSATVPGTTTTAATGLTGGNEVVVGNGAPAVTGPITTAATGPTGGNQGVVGNGASVKAAPSALPNLAANAVTVNTANTLNTDPAGPPGGTSANAGLPAKVTRTSTTAATGLTGGNEVVVGDGTKPTGDRLSSTLAKIPAGTTTGTSNPPKPGK